MLYDAENRLISTAGVTYTYDGDGKRVSKSTGGSAYKLYWTGMGSDPLEETDGSGNTTNEYIFFGGKRIARRDSSGNVFYYFADHLGTSRAIVQAGQTSPCYDADFYPYGGERTPITNTCSQSYRFTGKERDGESGLDNFGARYDSSWMGRFMSVDPENISGFTHMDDPQGWNGYAYVRNNPLVYVDPDGMNYRVCQQVENSRQEETNCATLTDDQYDQWRKDNQNLSVSAGGSIYSGYNKIGSAYYYNEKVGEALQEAGVRADIGVKAAMVATAPNYVVAAGAAAAAGGGTLIDLTAHGLVRTVGTRLMQMEATATVLNATKQFIQPNGRKGNCPAFS